MMIMLFYDGHCVDDDNLSSWSNITIMMMTNFMMTMIMMTMMRIMTIYQVELVMVLRAGEHQTAEAKLPHTSHGPD